MINFQQYKKLIIIATPIIGTSLASILSNIFGMLFVARLGHDQLAAGALVSSTYVALLVIATGSMYSVSILLAGTARDNTKEIKTIFHTAIIVGLLLASFIGTIFYFIKPLLILFHQNPTLIAIATKYFHTMIFALVLIIPYMVLQQFFIGTERPAVNLKITLVALLTTTSFAYVLILGKFGLPAFGLQGLAIAQIFSLFIILFLYLRKLIRSGDQQRYQLITMKFCFGYTTAIKILKIGLPIGIQYCAELAAMTVATYFIGWMGAQVLAAAQISAQMSTIAVMIFLGISQAASVLVSQSVSVDKIQLAVDYNRVANLTGLTLMGIVSIIFICVPHFLIHFYIDAASPTNQFVVHQATVLLAVSGFVLMLDAIRNITAGSLRGIHDSQSAMFWGIACQWLFALPLAYYFGFYSGLGAGGVRLGFVFGYAICVLILWNRFRSKMYHRLVLQTQAS